jgi:hypothetical protein
MLLKDWRIKEYTIHMYNAFSNIYNVLFLFKQVTIFRNLVESLSS